MELTSNQKHNLQILISIALGTTEEKIFDFKCKEVNEKTVKILFTRSFRKSELIGFNKYFNTESKNTRASYTLLVAEDKIKLRLLNNEFNDVEADKNNDDKLELYNRKITNTILKNEKYLKETLWPTDTKVKDWCFAFISETNPKYIGYAREDNTNEHCIKCGEGELPVGRKVIEGTRNDAEIICLRRNYNTKKFGNWFVVDRYEKIYFTNSDSNTNE